MILGNLAAITQDNVKRMLAYSSIAHAGYALLGIISMNAMGLRGVLIYTLVYVFANLGIWATVLMLRRHKYAGERVDDFDGLHKRAPFWAFAMVIFLLSLGGIPPTAGFIGKYFLFAAAVQSGFGWLAIIAVLMSAVSMFFYFRIVVAMYLKEGHEAEVAITPNLKLVAGVSLAVTLLFGILPAPLINQATRSSNWVATRAAVLTAWRTITAEKRSASQALEAVTLGWMFPVAIGLGLRGLGNGQALRNAAVADDDLHRVRRDRRLHQSFFRDRDCATVIGSGYDAAAVLRRIQRISFGAYIVFAVPVLIDGGFRGFLGLTCTAAVTMISFLWLEEIVEAVLQPSPRCVRGKCCCAPWRATYSSVRR